MSTLLISLVLALSISLYTYYRPRKDKNGVPYKLPPGPRGLPFIGNTFQLPVKPGDYLRSLSQKYGEMYLPPRRCPHAFLPVSFPPLFLFNFPPLSMFMIAFLVPLLTGRFTLQLGGATWVFVSSHRIMRELLDKKGTLYASKPHTPYLSETLSGGLRMALMEYGPKWRKLRKAMSIFNSPSEVKKFAKVE